MIFTRKNFKLSKVNIVNGHDRNKYKVTFTISNSINPTFLVYADNEQDALNFIADYTEKHELKLIFIDYYDLIDIVDQEALDDFFQADNGLYTDLNSVYIEQLLAF